MLDILKRWRKCSKRMKAETVRPLKAYIYETHNVTSITLYLSKKSKIHFEVRDEKMNLMGAKSYCPESKRHDIPRPLAVGHLYRIILLTYQPECLHLLKTPLFDPTSHSGNSLFLWFHSLQSSSKEESTLMAFDFILPFSLKPSPSWVTSCHSTKTILVIFIHTIHVIESNCQ